MEGPHLPFEGAAGWFEHVAGTHVVLDVLGGRGVPFRVRDAMVKPRAACAAVISSILAAEAPAKAVGDIGDIETVLVETYAAAKNGTGTGEQRWNPQSRETADHSIPYVVAATLMDGTVGPRQFRDDRLWNPDLRALIQRVEVVADDGFTAIYQQRPPQHHTRVTVRMRDGACLVGEAGGAKGDMANPPSDRDVEEKFRLLTEDSLGARRVRAVLDRLWALEDMEDVAALAALFVIA
jgi:2-methylcitrate dehydratase